MVRLDVTCMRHLSKEEFRVLTSIEMGMKNHELVPVVLITSIARLRHSGIHKLLGNLLRFKLIAHDRQSYDGYKLTYQGYDILALHTLVSRDVISAVGNKIGVGKESDIYVAQDPAGNEVVLKLHRLGRTSFRAVKQKRDYLRGRNKGNWLYLSRLSALKEFAFMKALHMHGFRTPTPIDSNRHCVVMSLVPGFPMYQIRAGEMLEVEHVLDQCVELLKRLARHGLIHGDFNEFNLMVDQNDSTVTLIDFPQMVSTNHYNAEELFNRDVECIVRYFSKKMKLDIDRSELPTLQQALEEGQGEERLDTVAQASGFTEEQDQKLSNYYEDVRLKTDQGMVENEGDVVEESGQEEEEGLSEEPEDSEVSRELSLNEDIKEISLVGSLDYSGDMSALGSDSCFADDSEGYSSTGFNSMPRYEKLTSDGGYGCDDEKETDPPRPITEVVLENEATFAPRTERNESWGADPLSDPDTSENFYGMGKPPDRNWGNFRRSVRKPNKKSDGRTKTSRNANKQRGKGGKVIHNNARLI